MENVKSEPKVLFESKSMGETNTITKKPKFQTTVYLKRPNKALERRLKRAKIKKIFVTRKKLVRKAKDGRWTLKEHIQFLQIFDKYGRKWTKIKGLMPTRDAYQVRSHAQKYYNKLKVFKDDELGIDFTKDNIKNLKDMINHVKSVNSNYNIVDIFLYISEKIKAIKDSKKIKNFKPETKPNLDSININVGNNYKENVNIFNNNIIRNNSNAKDNNVNNLLNLLPPIDSNINNNTPNNSI